jgi:hypothetical protein
MTEEIETPKQVDEIPFHELTNLNETSTAYKMITSLLEMVKTTPIDLYKVKINVTPINDEDLPTQSLDFIWKQKAFLEFLLADQLRLLNIIESHGVNIDDQKYYNKNTDIDKIIADLKKRPRG